MPRLAAADLAWALPLLAGLLVALPACQRQHYAIDTANDLGYPTCPLSSGSPPAASPGASAAPPAASPGASAAPPAASGTAPVVLVERTLRSGDLDTREPIVERYRIEKRGCLWAVVTRQEWPMQIADVEVLFDEALAPVRIWKRLTIPGSKRPDGNADFKRFEFRLPVLTTKHRDEKGRVDFEELRSKAPARAVIGPGRGIMSIWARRAHLEQNQKVREPVLDFRGVEKVSDITLARGPDKFLDWYGKPARVYTFLGRETFFADENDTVIGDLAGLMMADKSPTPVPRPLSTFEPPDPVHTP
jgi:hypothetical protein